MKKVGVALSGGAAYGIAHIGVLQAFLDHGIPVDCIAGTSAGSIVATGFAFGVSLEEMRRRASSLTWFSLSSLPDSKLGVASNRNLEKMMGEVIGDKDIVEADIPLAIVATDIESGRETIFRDGRAALAVRASACIPGLFTPVVIEEKKFVDGGLTENLPLSPLRAMGAEVRIGVNVLRWHSHKAVGNVIDVMTNSVSILASHQRHLVPQNVDILIEPDLTPYHSSDFQKVEGLIHEGYRAAMAKMPEIKKRIGVPSARAAAEQPSLLRRIIDWLSK